ncbi:amidase [Paenibacillus tengchongensis]|uniref:amidase n=1 Tax=Paenibacillus tengchongensis TaxID=2608684 RepID=UPI00124E2C16|nr:amidase [Paenibacillus tengchongensis]
MSEDNKYGAYIAPDLHVAPEGGGDLAGLAFAVKDVFAVAGHRSSAGNPDWLSSHEPAPEHAAAVRRLLLAGAALSGATHTDELMYSLGGENIHYGTPVNPRAEGHIPGGSSSGSAVAVAAGSADFALGTDTGGSVRVPSAYCGVYGFRPTHGVVDMEGVIPLAPGFDTVGWMAGSAELLLRVGRVLLERSRPLETAGKDRPPGINRLYIAEEAWQLLEPENAGCLESGLRKLMAGADRSEGTAIAPEGLRAWMDTFRELQGAEIWATHGAWIKERNPVFAPDIAARFAWAEGLDGQDHSAAQALQSDIAKRLAELLDGGGCLAVPTVPGCAPRRGGDLEQLERNRSGAMMLSCIAGLAGLPQVTLPVTGPAGYPLGLSVIAGPGEDLRLLSWISRIWK